MRDVAADLARTAGLVLAGGRSSRFGADKAFALFRGELLLDCAMRPLRDLPALAVSAKRGSAIAVLAKERRMPLVLDDPHGPDGPLAGILAGLHWAHARGFSFLASVPCDAPILPGDLVARLLAGRSGSNAAYAETTQGAHPLCAIWSTHHKEELGSILANRRHPRVRAVLSAVGAAPVWFETADAFANANTRDVLSDLEQAR